MAASNTYTRLYVQIVFAVKGRANLIARKHKEELHKYTTGIIQNRNHKLLAIHAMPDHVHIFVGLHPAQSISDLARDVKAGSSGFINEKQWVVGKFYWQEGYGAFSYSRSHIDAVVKYIDNQEAHHTKRSFRDEYIDLLQKFAIEYDEKYLFEFYE